MELPPHRVHDRTNGNDQASVRGVISRNDSAERGEIGKLVVDYDPSTRTVTPVAVPPRRAR